MGTPSDNNNERTYRHDTDIQRVVAPWNKSVIESRVLRQVTHAQNMTQRAMQQTNWRRREGLHCQLQRSGLVAARLSGPRQPWQPSAKERRNPTSGLAVALSISTMSTSIHDGLHFGNMRSRRRARSTPKMAARTWPTASRPRPCTAQHLKELVASQQP